MGNETGRRVNGLRYEQNLDTFDVFEGHSYAGYMARDFRGRWTFSSSDESIQWTFGRYFEDAWRQLCRRYHAR